MAAAMNFRSSSSSVMSLAFSSIAAHLLLLIFWKFSASLPSSDEDHSTQGAGLLLTVYIAKLPREFNLGLLQNYWKDEGRHDYPEDPLLKQHSAEYWLLRGLEKSSSSAVQVTQDSTQADVVFVPFFAALSAQLQLRGSEHGNFRKKQADRNSDYQRQRLVVDIVKNTPEWKRTGGRDHVFVLADPMAMWHVRHEVADSIFLLVDFGSWYREDAAQSSINNSKHSQVSLIKDVVVPHTHLLPSLPLSRDQPRRTLLYFRGERHRHRGGLIRDKLWRVLEDEADVVLETGLPDASGLKEATKGMRSSQFCLNPAGDTPSSCRLYDAIASLCIPVIVSDDIVLPFEGVLDYTSFSIFVATKDALRPGFLVQRLRNLSIHEKSAMRKQLSRVQTHFEYESQDGATSLTWRRVRSKVPLVKEAVARQQRSPGASTTTRCHCVS